MAPSAQDVFARLDSLEQDLEYIENAVGQDEIARLKLLDITRKAVARVETPWEVITRMYMEVFSRPITRSLSDPSSLSSIATQEFGHQSLSGNGFGKSRGRGD
jgi:hypothetical protein